RLTSERSWARAAGRGGGPRLRSAAGGSRVAEGGGMARLVKALRPGPPARRPRRGVSVTARRQGARAEPAQDELPRGAVTVHAVDHGRAEGAAADRVLQADGRTADRHRADPETAERHADPEPDAPA